jgi:hypothetical protein
MAFEVDHVPGEALDSRIERRERSSRPEQEMPVVHDAMRVPVGLILKLHIGCLLETRTVSVYSSLTLMGNEGHHEREHQEQAHHNERYAISQ